MNNIEKFLFELRDSAEIMYNIFTKGSCFRLYLIMRQVFPESIPYWSDMDNHCVVMVEGNFYDIGGLLSKKYVNDKGYYRVSDDLIPGYSLMRYTTEDVAKKTITVEKYST